MPSSHEKAGESSDDWRNKASKALRQLLPDEADADFGPVEPGLLLTRLPSLWNWNSFGEWFRCGFDVTVPTVRYHGARVRRRVVDRSEGRGCIAQPHVQAAAAALHRGAHHGDHGLHPQGDS